MATAVLRSFETCERSSENESETETETSTLKRNSFVSESTRTSLGTLRYKSRVGSQIYQSEQFNSDSDEANFFDEENEDKFNKTEEIKTVTRVSRIDLSPEAEKKRKESYNKWLNSVIAQEKDRKRLAREREAAEKEVQKELEKEMKAKSEEKVLKWMHKKRIEADKKLACLNELQKMSIQNEKPKVFKKSINFEDWLKMKNEKLLTDKKQTTVKETKNETSKRRESISHERWLRTSSSKPKPVPMSRGLDSLKGSTTKLFVNPEPWKFDE